MPITGTDPARMPARMGHARLGASRLGYYWPTLRVTINGVNRDQSYVRLEGFTIQDELDSVPNTATLRVDGFVPSHGHPITIHLGDRREADLLFQGTILECTKVYDLLPTQRCYDLSCISEEWKLNARKVTARYLSLSATLIVLDLVATYAPWLEVTGVEDDLESLDEITFTNEDLTDALDRIRDRIGGRWVVDGITLHFGTTIWPGGAAEANAVTDGDYHTLIAIAAATDLSQVRTRVLVEGGGSQAAVEVVPGETILSVEDPVWYDADGGTVTSGPQRITYTGVAQGGSGALIGTPAQPTTAPAVAVNWGTSGMAAGTYLYAVTFTDASGETLPGPTASIALAGTISPPSAAPVGSIQGSGATQSTGNYQYVYTFTNGSGETTASPASNVVDVDFNTQRIGVSRSGLSTPPAGFALQFYRDRDTESGGYKRMHGPSDGFDYDDSSFYYSVTDPVQGDAPSPPGTNTAIAGSVTIDNIPLGPTGTTSRKLYRTTAGGSQLKLLTTISNNTSSGPYVDTTADGSLGANVPTANTSSLVSSTGTVLAGSTSIPVAGTGPFAAGGGWAQTGSVLVRYTGFSSTALTGVPSSGSGALSATLTYGTELVALPALTGIPATGVGGILWPIAKGEDVNLLVTRNDLAAQTALAALLGGDGVIEDFIQDRRLSQTEAEARGDARLLEVKDPEVRITAATRDRSVRAGRDWPITITNPDIDGSFKIQRVTLSDFDAVQRRWPVRQVDASSRKFTFEQLLQFVNTE